MAYQPPSIGSDGFSIPSYQAILAWLNQNYLAIFGQSAYLGSDSADEMDIAIRSLQAANTNQALQAIYLSFNPLTAIGASLDLIGMLIGTRRDAATNSTVVVTLTGNPGTVITSGVVSDTNGNYWNLGSPATIGGGGTVNVIATAQNVGAITVNIGAVTTIVTPTAGWTSVTNSAAGVPGVPVEADSHYRARLLISQSQPSLALRTGTAANVAGVAGVTRSIVYENQYGNTTSYGVCNTANVDSASPPNDNVIILETGYPFDATMVGNAAVINNGSPNTILGYVSPTELTLTTPPGTQTGVPFYIGDGIALGPKNSITCVVEGGAAAAIALAIYTNKCPGCLTNGTTSTTVTDPNNPTVAMVISFDVLAYLPIYVSLNVHPLQGFTSATQAAIIANIVAYLNSLGIGHSVVWSELFGAAVMANPNPAAPLFSIHALTLGVAPGPSGTADVPVSYNVASSGITADVIVTLV